MCSLWGRNFIVFGVISSFVLEVADDCSINLHYWDNLCYRTALIALCSIQGGRKMYGRVSMWNTECWATFRHAVYEPLSFSLCSAFTFCLVPHLDTLMERKTCVCGGATSQLQIIVTCHHVRNAPLLIIGGSVRGSVTVGPGQCVLLLVGLLDREP